MMACMLLRDVVNVFRRPEQSMPQDNMAIVVELLFLYPAASDADGKAELAASAKMNSQTRAVSCTRVPWTQ